jgi:two-component system LytT family response regulator
MKPNARQVALVEDSPHERLLLRTMLERLPDIEIAGEASDLKGAKALLERPELDLVFLDVELGRENIFTLLRGAGKLPPVVFTTVHRQFALSAFDVEAVDYLVKPVREDRLLRALAKLDSLLGRSGRSRITLERGGSDRQLVSIDSVLAVEADGKHSMVHTAAGSHPDRRSLRDWEALLAKGAAERLDRSTLLRLGAVLAVRPYGRGAKITFRNSALILDLGRAAAERLAEVLPGGK